MIVYLDNILIYTASKGKEYVQAIQWVLDQLQKYSLYAKFKKGQYHQDEVKFLGYILFHQCIQMKKE